jgi:hypothetical protein
MFEDIRFLPFKKLRMSLASRALCLCAPDMKVPDNNHANDIPQVSSHCCWPVILRWIEMVIGHSDPFAVDLYDASAETVLSDPLSYAYAISESFSHDAAMVAGLTFFTGKPFNAMLSRASTVIEPEVAAAAYTSLAFNLLVNRVARLAGRRIMQNTSSVDKITVARDIEGFLCKELIICRVCTAPDQVSIKVDDEGKLDISLNSDVLIGGYPARFSFSLEI